MARFEREPKEYVEKVVYLNRVSKTVKGGRVSKFSALVVVGDEKGKVGYGLGKAAEVAEAIRKGIEDAKKHMVTITLSDNTIPHEVIGEFGAGRVLLKPASKGTGIIAGGPVRAVMEAAGVSDIRAKCLRTNNPQNVVAATMEGLKALRSPAEVARIRATWAMLMTQLAAILRKPFSASSSATLVMVPRTRRGLGSPARW